MAAFLRQEAQIWGCQLLNFIAILTAINATKNYIYAR